MRQHFHIPKFHMMEHYVESIKLRGTADGFNTELPERLHIDFAKVAYRASSRHDYTIQMTQWITRQEKVHAFGMYVAWSCPDEGEEEDENPEAGKEVDTTAVAWSFHLAKQPGFRNTPVWRIMQDFRATHFLHALSAYMARKVPGNTRRINENTSLNLYKRVRFTLGSTQETDDDTVSDVVRATPFVPRHGRTPSIPAHFDTAIIHDPEETGKGGKCHVLRYAHGAMTYDWLRIPSSSCTCNLPTPSRSEPPPPTCLRRMVFAIYTTSSDTGYVYCLRTFRQE
jgi:hypothetical protein